MRLSIVLFVALLALPARAQMPPFAWDDGTVPYVTTPTEVVERMMIIGGVKHGDRVVDLGSGDGRIVIAAAKRGASALGVDLDPSLVRLATENARKAGVAERARFEVRDIFETDLSRATVVTMYLLPEFNAKLLERFLKLAPGTRIVIAAAKRGASGLGVDLDPSLVKLATENARKAGVAERARFEVRDIFDTDLSRATVVTMYLLPEFNVKLLERFLKLAPGTRIVSHDGGIGDWPPDESWELRTPEKPVGIGGNSRIDLWIVPGDVAGDWTSDLPQHGGEWRFHIAQRYQMLEVDARTGGHPLVVRNTRLRGEEVKLVVTGLVGARAWHHYFVGRVRGDAIDGEVTVSNGERQVVYPWHARRK